MSLKDYYDLEESILTQVKVDHLQMDLELVFTVYRHAVRGFVDDMLVRLRFTGVETLRVSNEYHDRLAQLPDILEAATWSWNEVAVAEIAPSVLPGLHQFAVYFDQERRRRIEVIFLHLEFEDVIDRQEIVRQMALVGARED